MKRLLEDSIVFGGNFIVGVGDSVGADFSLFGRLLLQAAPGGVVLYNHFKDNKPIQKIDYCEPSPEEVTAVVDNTIRVLEVATVAGAGYASSQMFGEYFLKR